MSHYKAISQIYQISQSITLKSKTAQKLIKLEKTKSQNSSRKIKYSCDFITDFEIILFMLNESSQIFCIINYVPGEKITPCFTHNYFQSNIIAHDIILHNTKCFTQKYAIFEKN
ncbi:hypothetical protein BpHYR1_038158 [Brachionus plicatilis]|uniref:Uncharacterized protein n=1 Tax=Brachionus plicatilis TaxID=10195 RepID=A0A3M7Q200_BRAPC|nr:hypothetical protein BpHYR1_038158 [Brachionus plicatilis]